MPQLNEICLACEHRAHLWVSDGPICPACYHLGDFDSERPAITAVWSPNTGEQGEWVSLPKPMPHDNPTCNGDYHHARVPRNLVLVECFDSCDDETGECIHWCVWCIYEANRANGETADEALLLALGARPLDNEPLPLAE